MGGGSGAHAEWLAAGGHDVELLDRVPGHVARAAPLPGARARHGGAHALDVPDASVDVVLLLGPLHHLPERADRVRALAQARRVARPAGLVVAAINRCAGLHDTLARGMYVDAAAGDGRLRPGRAPEAPAAARPEVPAPPWSDAPAPIPPDVPARAPTARSSGRPALPPPARSAPGARRCPPRRTSPRQRTSPPSSRTPA
ncbi:hypothetical protein GCM10010260_40010 [Streptomyces filipinensis]|uniref:Methyltransferase type 11 domain-containing protein n=1 Tax=Streptomyces filipinensis TaxID=66887 RepID=A0A918MCB4_9ACTN|nr:hypothetical protein GCM10010260_40010 [Streptomyces filipinensis]